MNIVPGNTVVIRGWCESTGHRVRGFQTLHGNTAWLVLERLPKTRRDIGSKLISEESDENVSDFVDIYVKILETFFNKQTH